jgi:[ribosomal protein S5]-alanine N-acetyltransferase
MTALLFTRLPTLDTERLLLRALTMADAADLFAYASDPAVARYTSWEPHHTLTRSRRFLESVRRAYQQGRVAPWGIVHRADGRLIGTCGFVSWQPEHRRAEIGYALARPYWGQGYATEAVRAVITFGFTRARLNRIQAICLPENVASARVLEKAGMSLEGTLRHFAVIKGEPVDLQLFAILRQDAASFVGERHDFVADNAL